MNRTELLDKLAMEMAEWREELILDLLPSDWKSSYFLGGEIRVYEKGRIVAAINRYDWNQRRRELINEPDDRDAPSWAKWVAQDSYGEWYWNLGKPCLSESNDRISRDGWYDFMNSTALAARGKIPAGHDWRKTLRKVERKACPQNEPEQPESRVVTDSKGGPKMVAIQLSEAIKKFSEKYPGLTAEPSKQDRIAHHIKKAEKHLRKARKLLEVGDE